MSAEPFDQVEHHILQIWMPSKGVWFDVKDIADRAEAAFIAGRANENFPQDKFRVCSRPGGIEHASPFPRSFDA